MGLELIGQRIGVYEIRSLLGRGGMGEVYRARDTRLGRDVAIKVLPTEFTRDPDRRARFEREAHLLASLNHPHVGAIHGLEDAAGVPALVLELVEGETLAERIAQGPIAVLEALTMARQIAEALEAAHEHGIIHRDLKPANIKVTPDGTVKVLDFGLAKILDSVGRDFSRADSIDTQDGTLLGTAAYMSPEQARGQRVDKRTDIWAFGCVLYEMLTGRPAFAGETASDTIAAIIEREPDWSRLPPGMPRRVQDLLRLCLVKDVRKRRQGIGDVRLDVEHAIDAPQPSPSVAAQPARRARLTWTVSCVLAIVAVVAAFLALRPAPSPPEMRLQILTPPTSFPFHFALSPDGNHIAFVAASDGHERLWVRALATIEARPLPGTEGAGFPFWSADGRSIGFFASGKLQRIDVSGGPPQPLADVPSPHGGTWNADGVILFAASSISPLMRIAESGGEPVPVTRVAPAPFPSGHSFPHFLPDGRHFLFHLWGSPEVAGIYLGTLDGGEPKRLTLNDTAGAYLEPDRVVYVRHGALVARRLDLERGELLGDPDIVAEPVGVEAQSRRGGFSVSADGRVAHRVGDAQTQLTWIDRTGKTLGVVSEAGLAFPELAPDGTRVAMQRGPESDVWIADLRLGTHSKFTFRVGVDAGPIWSPDGTRIAYASNRTGWHDLYVMSSNTTGTEQLLMKTPAFKWPQDWSNDGESLLYLESERALEWNLSALTMTDRQGKRFVVANTPFDERHGQFSPNGRYVAYATNESGRFEIVVQPFPEATRKWQISTAGGLQPRWRSDGKELYFVAPGGAMMAAAIVTADKIFKATTPVRLFHTRVVGGGIRTNSAKADYDVSRDGRFLINQLSEGATNSPITLILNWKPKP